MTLVRVPGCRGTLDMTEIDLAVVGRFDGGIEWAYLCPVCIREHHQTTTPDMLLRLIDTGVAVRWAWDHWPLIFEVADQAEERTRARKH